MYLLRQVSTVYKLKNIRVPRYLILVNIEEDFVVPRAAADAICSMLNGHQHITP
jgi:hypothetical protein